MKPYAFGSIRFESWIFQLLLWSSACCRHLLLQKFWMAVRSFFELECWFALKLGTCRRYRFYQTSLVSTRGAKSAINQDGATFWKQWQIVSNNRTSAPFTAVGSGIACLLRTHWTHIGNRCWYSSEARVHSKSVALFGVNQKSFDSNGLSQKQRCSPRSSYCRTPLVNGVSSESKRFHSSHRSVWLRAISHSNPQQFH